MNVFVILAVSVVVIAATVWFMIIAPNRKRKAHWKAAIPAAIEEGAEERPGKHGFPGLVKETEQGPIVGMITAGLMVERNLINRRQYRSDGSAFYTNITFRAENLPRFEVSGRTLENRVEDRKVGPFYVAADDIEAFDAIWTEEATELMKRSGAPFWSVLSGGNQIQAVCQGIPQSTEELRDMWRLVDILASRSAMRQRRAA